MSFFKSVMIVLLKIYAAGKTYGKICLKAITDKLFFQNVVCDQGRERKLGVISNRKGKFKPLILQGDPRPQFPPLVWYPNFSMRKILESAWSAYLMILKRVGDSIFFQSNKFTACKVKDEKQVANSLMAFSPLKIIHPLQGKKHLRTFRFK